MSDPRNQQKVYKVIFNNQGKVFELYARNVYQGNMYGFVEIEELLFGNKSSLLVDPSEDRLKTEFAGVKRTFLPMHTVIRIDEVEQEGVSKVRAGDAGDNVAMFPHGVYTPDKKTD